MSKQKPGSSIQMKKFFYKPLLGMGTKQSSKVCFNLNTNSR